MTAYVPCKNITMPIEVPVVIVEMLRMSPRPNDNVLGLFTVYRKTRCQYKFDNIAVNMATQANVLRLFHDVVYSDLLV